MGLIPDAIEVAGVEAWREYDWRVDDMARVYRIENPQRIYVGVTTHRVVDAEGIVHVVPAPGYYGCVVRFLGTVVA